MGSKFLSAYPAAWEKIHTKADLKSAVKEGRNLEFRVQELLREGYMALSDLQPGVVLNVSNHPKRSWFASVERTVKGTVKVS